MTTTTARSAAGLCALLALLPAHLSAQPGDADARAEFDRMRFLLGEWAVEARIRNGPDGYLRGSGTMSVRLAEDGETFLADMDIEFEGFDVVGTTVRRYDPARKLWNIAWEADQGAEPHIEGHWIDGRLVEINWGTDARGPFIGRLVKRKISHDRFEVRKDRLYDDGAVLPETWAYEATRVSGPGGVPPAP